MKLQYCTCALMLGLLSAQAGAQELGRVISSQPVIQQVAVPRQVCTDQLVEVAPPKSGAGAVLGAVAGGAIGNAVGRGSGNAAATVIGVLGGAVLGDRIEGSPPGQLQNVRSCHQQAAFENRTVGYNVVYEYAGRQYATQMANDPGPTVAVQVSPVGSASPAPGYTAQAPVLQQSYGVPQVVESRIIYQPYYTRPYVLPPVQFRFGRGDDWGGHHHWR
jgi:uncharacterized protein YcfJ